MMKTFKDLETLVDSLMAVGHDADAVTDSFREVMEGHMDEEDFDNYVMTVSGIEEFVEDLNEQTPGLFSEEDIDELVDDLARSLT